MRIIPVIDVMNGRAVHARGGDRAHYAPVRSILHEGSEPLGIAGAFRDRLGLEDVYVADLDAIAGRSPDLDIIERISALALRVWVDAGLREADDATRLIDSGASVVVAGLETLSGPDALRDLIARTGADRVAFSLDLRGGRPCVETARAWGTDDPRGLAARAIEAGATRMIVLDLSRVGMGGGVGTVRLLECLAADHPAVEVIAGGGVAGQAHLDALPASPGRRRQLVGSALHDGRIGRGRG